MIESVKIKNFKSVVDLSLELGSFNIFIGENGCGKSNILEAIAFGAAASADKLDHEFLGSRGIRITNPEFMFSAFTKNIEKHINLEFKTDNKGMFNDYKYELLNDSKNTKKWINRHQEITSVKAQKLIESIIFENDLERKKEKRKLLDLDNNFLERIDEIGESIDTIVKTNLGNEKDKIDFFKFMFEKYRTEKNSNDTISNFIVYSPEQTSLRKFEETTQIYPLGIRGEGLFQYLKELSLDKKNNKILKEIKKSMLLLDWYDDFSLPNNLMKTENSLKIRDKYLDENIEYFDQRSTNEGFLYLLFYSTLFLSEITPSFFAIDNIDASFNPKLCVQLTKTLSKLSKKNKRQVILTTHNPAILDGIDLKDDNQRLFVIRRNDEGHTTAKRIYYKSERKMKLSEVWTNGFIGGLPDNF